MTHFNLINTKHKLHINRGNLKSRLAKFKDNGKRRICGPYTFESFATDPNYSFYHDSDFALGLRWQWCDTVINEHSFFSKPHHEGWFTDDFGNEVVRGVVFRLPNKRGYLAGNTFGEGMVGCLDKCVYSSILDAAMAADSQAEYVAEQNRNYLQAEEYRDQIQVCRETIKEYRSEFKELHAELPTTLVGEKTCKLIKYRLLELREGVREQVQKIRDTMVKIELLEY